MTKSNFILFLLFITLGGCVTSSPQRPSPNQNNTMAEKTFTYLALGDSYTIGEGVKQNETYPAQLVELLAAKNLDFEAPKIIAVTGWTTDELQQGIKAAAIDGKTYDLVTLLIGVNNQYRGRSIDNYKEEFTNLLHQAIDFAGGHKNHVIVLSIPDWGVTEFAKQQNVNQEKVAEEIDAFNQAQKEICDTAGITFLDITTAYREQGNWPENQADDGLHPSGNIYSFWAEKLAVHIMGQVKF